MLLWALGKAVPWLKAFKLNWDGYLGAESWPSITGDAIGCHFWIDPLSK